MKPKESFSLGSSLLKSLISGQGWACILGESFICNDSALNYSLWDALVHYLEGVCGVLMKNIESNEVMELTQEGLELLRISLQLNTQDPTILSYALSCTSNLFFFITFSPELHSPVLEKIFTSLTFTLPNQDQCKEIWILKKHACGFLIKLAVNFPKLLLPALETLHQHVQKFNQATESSQYTKSALLEALTIISNELYDYEKQSHALKEMFAPTLDLWSSDRIKMAISSPESFIDFVGLDKVLEESADMKVYHTNSSEVSLCINTLRGCIKRCRWPEDPEKARKGGFIHPMSSTSDTVYYRSPCAPFVIPTLKEVFLLIRTLNTLHDPTFQAIFHPNFAGILEISDYDKKAILGIPCTDSSHHDKSPFERKKLFLHFTYESCVTLLKSAVENLTIDFYTIPALSSTLTESLYFGIQHLTDLKLKFLIRSFLKPYFLHCPSFAHGDLINVLSGLCPFMHQKLSARWEKFRLMYGTSVGYEAEQTETQEVLEDQLNRLLTRDYIYFLEDILHHQPAINDLNEDCMDEDIKDNSAGILKSISELGVKIIHSEAVRATIICTAFDALHWLDTVTNMKTVKLCEIIFKRLLEDSLIRHSQEATYIFKGVLYGLQELGEHEANEGAMLALAVNVYENLKPRFPEVQEVLVSCVNNCDNQLLMRLEETFFENGAKRPGQDKQKKESLRRVIATIIGKNIGQHHKRDVVIKNLAPLLIFARKKNSDLIEAVNEDIGLCNLFSSSDKES